MLHSRYSKSTRMLARAEKVIPLGSQTFSKSKVQFPAGVAPMFLERGVGSHVWDVDGNEYIDLVNGLLPVILGYSDPDVNQAIMDQLHKGISFSLPSELEIKLAEKLVEIIPCADQVRYGKNGTDATSAAVRIAQAFTGRDRIAAGGYHGWQDWYIGATVRNKGVPDVVGQLTRKFNYNDIDDLARVLEDHPGEYAAVIMEPMNSEDPKPGYLTDVLEITHHHGALLIFDEVITGFRFSIGGAQEMFNVTPDLAAFGKSLGNGMPISVVCGKKEYMQEVESIFLSSTFGGETLSLAAALAVINKMQSKPVIQQIWDVGATISDAVETMIKAHNLSNVISLMGKPCWKIISFHDHENADKDVIKTFFIREMLANGILINASHNISFAHTGVEVDIIVKAYENVLEKMATELKCSSLADRLGCRIIRPVFSIR